MAKNEQLKNDTYDNLKYQQSYIWSFFSQWFNERLSEVHTLISFIVSINADYVAIYSRAA